MAKFMSLVSLRNEIMALPFVVQADEIVEKEDGDYFDVRLEDKDLSETAFELGAYFTPEFITKTKTKFTNLCKNCLGVIGDFVKVDLTHQDKDWFRVKVIIK